ncbi:MAG: hypothetical protein AB1649_22290 [Chloroflexota bacterium]
MEFIAKDTNYAIQALMHIVGNSDKHHKWEEQMKRIIAHPFVSVLSLASPGATFDGDYTLCLPMEQLP